jgi:hypothetical protein
MSDEQPLSDAVIAAIQRGRKIDAIKILREETGVGLKEAKHTVDAYVRRHPAMASQIGPKTETPFGRLLIGGAVVTAAIAIYRYFS